MSDGWNNFVTDFQFVFMEDDRVKSLFQGLGNTLIITFFAVMIGIVLGSVVATVRTTYDKNHSDMKKRNPVGFYVLGIANVICKIYLTVIRGTPVVVQLMIAYFIIFATSNNSTAVAIFAFGINSGAYVAEIVRGGIMSIDEGQFEAGRSLGLTWSQTMRKIVIPQAFRRTIPQLGNEFIAMLKDSSLVSVIGFEELTRKGQLIIAATYRSFEIWTAVAIIYLIMTLTISRLVAYLEKKYNSKGH